MHSLAASKYYEFKSTQLHLCNDARAKQMEERSKMTGAGASRSKICVLDDDASFVQATGQLLSSVGLPTKQFTDPYAFLDYVRMHRPWLAIIDICMPAMNGLEVQTRLRTHSPSTRVIVLTARDDPSTRTKAMDGGASAFFLKAGSEEELLARVQSLSSES
jgi:FixJ family two-component response regulator